MQVVGVDGYTDGWIAAVYDSTQQYFTLRTYTRFRELIERCADAACIAVDIPVGLAEGESRRPDLEARKVLGPRRNSVFPAPDHRLLSIAINKNLDHRKASKFSRSLLGKGVSKQAFAIFSKISEVNEDINPELQQRVVEVHPEVSFWALAGKQPLINTKKTKEGFDERRVHLSQAFATHIPIREDASRILRPVKADDILGAMVAAWTAQRFATGKAERLPTDPARDHQGLRMEIVY